MLGRPRGGGIHGDHAGENGGTPARLTNRSGPIVASKGKTMTKLAISVLVSLAIGLSTLARQSGAEEPLLETAAN